MIGSRLPRTWSTSTLIADPKRIAEVIWHAAGEIPLSYCQPRRGRSEIPALLEGSAHGFTVDTKALGNSSKGSARS